MQCGKNMLLLGLLAIILALLLGTCNAGKIKKKSDKAADKQLFIQSKETSPMNFVRLLVMRLIYGIATQMGVEERLAGLFNGAFVPPNADDDYGDFGFDGDLDLFGDDY